MSRSRFLIVSLLSLGVLCSLFVFYDNTDSAVRNFSSDDFEIRMFAGDDAELLKALREANENTVEAITFDQQDALRCLKDPTATGNAKEQLQSFVEGECAPIIMLPGFTGTKLMVEINCEELQEHSPEVMKACGWGTCNSWDIFKKKPNSEYLLWIPQLHTPLNTMAVDDGECFGLMMSFDYKSDEKSHLYKYSNIRGLNVTWYGNTPETYNDADGGFNAVQDMMPLPVQNQESKQFRGLADNFVKMGYQKGLSLFAVPYDFRLTHMANSVYYSLERTIRYAFELTGKKVVIMAHSLGNVNTLSVLNRMSQADKDKMVATYIALTPAIGGTPANIRTHVGGDNGLLKMGGLVGLKFRNQRHMFSGLASLYELMPGDFFFRFKNEPWMKEIIARVEAEEKYDIKTTEGKNYWLNTKNIPLSWFPNPSSTCFKSFKNRPEECRTMITDLKKTPIAVIEGEKFYANREDNYKVIQERFKFVDDTEKALSMYKDALENNNYLLTNPGVPVVFVYGSHLPTEFTNEWDRDPELTTATNQFAYPDRTIKKYGDNTIEVSYALPIALKWAWENRNRVSNAKPIKVVEYCSTNNTEGNIWDESAKLPGTIRMSQTEYIGLGCECWKEGNIAGSIDGSNCAHSSILNDKYWFEFMKKVVITKQKVSGITAAYKLANSDIVELMRSLPHLRAPREEKNVQKLLYGTA